MSVNIGWFSVPLDPDSTAAAMARVAAHAPAGDRDEKFTLHAAPNGTVVIARTEVSSWAQAVSQDSMKPVVSFLMLEGQWSMDVFTGGEHALFIDSHHPDLEPLLGGDIDGVADVFSIKPKVFKRFHKLLVEDEEQEELAFRKDKIPAADEWGCCQLAEHLGIANYPDDPDSGGEEFVVGEVSQAGDWAGLPDRLSLSVCAPKQVPKRLRFGNDEQQRDSLAWAENWAMIAPMLALSVVDRIEAKGPKSPGVRTWVDAMSIECHHAMGNQQNASERAEVLMSAWLGPVVAEAPNQYINLFGIQRIAEFVRPYAADDVLALCNRVQVAEEPDLALPEGDFF